MKQLAFVLLIITVCLCSCSKKEKLVTPSSTPASTGATTTAGTPGTTTNGGINGIISPAGASIGVTAVGTVSGQAATYKATPDTTGHFTFSGLPAGSYTVSFTMAAGYTALTNKTVTVNAGAVSNLDFVFATLINPGSITGTIYPIGASVNITANGKLIAKTSYDNGSFKFSALPAGTYTITFVPQTGFLAPATKTLTLAAGQNAAVGRVDVKAISPGSISGTISPGGSSVSVWAASSDLSSFVSYTVTPDAGGRFQILNLPARQYYVGATPNAGSNLYAPYSRFYTVSAGQNTDVGNIGLTTTPPPYPFSCFIEGTAYSSTAAPIAYSADKQTLTVSSSVGGFFITISIAGVTGPGEYPCKRGSSAINCTIPGKSGPTPESPTTPSTVWNTWSAGGSGIIKITSIDPVNKTISGTFSGTLSPSTTSATGVKTITNGAFTGLQYQ